MYKNESADVRGGNLETPAAPTSGVVVPFERTTSSVGPRSASSNPNHRNSGGFLDVRAALRTVSRTLRGYDANVYAELAAMAGSTGEAFPRLTTLAECTGIGDRLVRLSLRRLEARGLISSRVLGVGEQLPGGGRVFGHPLRVFRVHAKADPQIRNGSRDPGSPDPSRIPRSSNPADLQIRNNRISRSAAPYEDPKGRIFPTTTIDKTAVVDASGDPSAPGAPPPPEPTPPGIEREDASSSSSQVAPVGAPVTFASSQPASETRLASAALERAMCTGSRAHCTDVADGGHKEGRASGDPASSSRSVARSVLERWAELVAPRGVVVAPLHTTRRLNAIADRLRDGFAADELVELVAHAVGNTWHLQNPTRLEARFLFRTSEDVATELSKARTRRRSAGAKRAEKTSGGSPAGGACSGVQRPKSEPPVSREQMVTGAAAFASFEPGAPRPSGGAK